MRFPPALPLALLAALTVSCGNKEASPTSPREAIFQVNGAQSTAFDVIELRSADAIHRPCPLGGQDHFSAPYQFILENAVPPVQGRFDPVAAPLSNVLLTLGGDSVPLRVDNPTADTPVFTGATALPEVPPAVPCQTDLLTESREVRFEVSGTTGIEFSAVVGDQFGNHIGGIIFNVPATVYLEDAQERVSGVFTKQGSGGVLTVQLLVNGDEVDSGSTGDGSTDDIVVKHEF